MIRPLLCTLALATLASGAAQTLTTNAQGQRVIVYPDGTERLFDAPGEQATPERADAGEGPPAASTLPPPPTLRTQTTPEDGE